MPVWLKLAKCFQIRGGNNITTDRGQAFSSSELKIVMYIKVNDLAYLCIKSILLKNQNCEDLFRCIFFSPARFFRDIISEKRWHCTIKILWMIYKISQHLPKHKYSVHVLLWKTQNTGVQSNSENSCLQWQNEIIRF